MSSRSPAFLGHSIRELRGRLGLGQQETARRLGISISYLSQIESGVRPLTAAVLGSFYFGSAALAHAWPPAGEARLVE